MLYNSPERIKNQEKNWLNKQDPWALGVIAYYLCEFRYPFEGDSSSAVVYSIAHTK